MADVARTRAYTTKGSSSSDAAAVERSIARRRRRNQMRSSGEAAADGEAVQLPSEEEDVVGEGRSEQPPAVAVGLRGGSGRPPLPGTVRRPAAARVEWRSVVPVAGAVAVAGRQRQMEDAVTIWMGLCAPLINRGLPVHYFGVYDGHGGSHV